MPGSVVYNELDHNAIDWLRRLCTVGHISAGEVIEQDITELDVKRVINAQRFHAFAGIGLWDYALTLARWPTDVPVWTGSCPCQPFSIAGKQRGTADKRHLWPEWLRLIRECCPPVIFGEQVASPAGRTWLDNVSIDLEALGYAVGSADLCAAGVGAPHIRQRLFFVAYAIGKRCDWFDALLWSKDNRRQRSGKIPETTGRSKASDIPHPSGNRHPSKGEWTTTGYTHGVDELQLERKETQGFWSTAVWIGCKDGKARPLEPGTIPVVDGYPGRLDQLRAYGNAIVPQVAATFIEAALNSIRHESV